MTIKEIMQLTGKAKNTVCLWCSKIEQVSSKIEQAKNKRQIYENNTYFIVI